MDIDRQLITVLLLLGAFYIALAPLVCTPLYQGMLFHPQKFPLGQYEVETLGNVHRSEFFFPTTNGLKLHGWFFQNPAADKVILLSHGNAGNLTSRLFLTKILLDLGVSVFIYDYRGYGASEGKPSLQGICDDGLAAYNFLQSQLHIKPQQLILYGESLGVAVSCQILKQSPCAAVILQSGFSSLRQVSHEQVAYLRLYPQWLYPRPDLDNARILRQAHPPLLLLHGEKDTLLPISHAEELYRQASQPKELIRIPEADHNSVPDCPEFVPAMTNFLAQIR